MAYTKAIKPNDKQLGKIVKALSKKFSVKTKSDTAKLYKALEDNDFVVIIKDVAYKVYASHIIALMHNGQSKSKGLKLS